MNKMGLVTCDCCHVVICGAHPREARPKIKTLIKYRRVSKKGTMLNFCSPECFQKDTKPKELR